MKQIYSLFTVLFLLSILLFSCSEENEEGCDIIKSAENNKYSVVIDSGSSAESRAITDLVQGGGNYSEGSLVKLYTKDRKFMATAVGSAGTTWLQNGDPNSTTILTSSINQDWSVAIKYYSDVILDCTAPGGDGSKVTKTLEVGSQLPDPVVTAGYTFEGWYEGGTRVYIVPESSNRTITGKFTTAISISDYIFVGANAIIFSNGKKHIVGNATWRSIIYANGRYITVGSNYITSSTDGVIWITPKQVGESIWQGITYGNGKFVVIGTDGYITTSTDGVNWTKPEKQITLATSSITYANGKFVAVGLEGYIASSTDGVNWSTKYKASENWNAVTYGNGKFVAVGRHGFALNSSDGDHWFKSYDVKVARANGIIYANGKFVAVGDNGLINISLDGYYWGTKGKVGDVSWQSITYANGKFVAVGSYGYMTSSTDGENWTEPRQLRDESGNILTSSFLYSSCPVVN